MKGNFRSTALAHIVFFIGLPILLASCSNPNSAPGTNSISPADYSASAFFNTQSLGDTSTVPFPFCFPGAYIQQQLGLTDSQVTALENLQDSLRLSLQAKLDSMKAAGTLNRDSVRALRLEYQTELYTGIAAILTPAQLSALQNLRPPNERPDFYGRGPRYFRRRDYDRGSDSARIRDSVYATLTQAQRDSIRLAHIESTLAAAGDTLSANQIALIQNLQVSIDADTTLTREGRRAEFEAQLQTILTAKQYSDLRGMEFADNRSRHR